MNAHISSRTIAAIRGTAILDTLPDGAYITDCDRKIVFWNQSAQRIMGWTADDVTGRNCSDNILVHVDKNGHALCGNEYCPLHRSIVTGTPSAEPILVYAKHQSGIRVPVEVSVAPIRDDNGHVVGGIELFRDLSELEADLTRARDIQNTLLESTLPNDPRLAFDICYTPSGVVGGDFYRIERLDAERYVILLADIMGHGVASALYTMLLRTLWEDCRPLLPDPAALAAELNRRLRTLAGDCGYFATAICLVINADTGLIQYVRAGHPAPILHHTGSTAPLPGKSQPALGMLTGITYTETQVVMQPGETILLYTDGAIEACDTEDRELGTEGLAEILANLPIGTTSLSDMNRVEESILRYSGVLHPADDLTLIAITRHK